MLTTKRVLPFLVFLFCLLAPFQKAVAQYGDWNGSISGNPQVVTPGQTAKYSITIIPVGGFTGDVTLSASGIPFPYSFSPPVVTGGSGTTVLTITTDPATHWQEITFQITGTSGTLSHSTSLTLEMIAAGDFTGSVSPEAVIVTPGQTATYTVNLVPLGNFTGNVSLTVSGLPTGVSATFNPAVVNASNPTSALTITPPAGFSDFATYILPLTGSSGSIVHTHSVTLEIAPSTGGNPPSSTQVLKRIKLLNLDPGAAGGLPLTTLFVAPQDGFYRLSGYMFVTARDPSAKVGLVPPVVNWTDDSGSQTAYLTNTNQPNLSNFPFPPFGWNSLGNSVGGTLLLYAKASTPVTVYLSNASTPTPTSARYSLYITIEEF